MLAVTLYVACNKDFKWCWQCATMSLWQKFYDIITEANSDASADNEEGKSIRRYPDKATYP